MSDKIKILAIIPARGGSKGVPRKNIKILNGKPLLAYTIESAIRSKIIDKIVVSTDDKEIALVAKKYGAEVIKRPKILADDTALTEPVMNHALEELEKVDYKPDYISLIQPTSPFLKSEIIKKCVKKIEKDEFDSCLTVFVPHSHEFKWKKRKGTDEFVPEHNVENRPRRQDMEVIYHENGAFYITKTELFKKTNSRFGGNLAKITTVEMTEENSLQIDNYFDFWLAEKLLKNKNKKYE